MKPLPTKNMTLAELDEYLAARHRRLKPKDDRPCIEMSEDEVVAHLEAHAQDSWFLKTKELDTGTRSAPKQHPAPIWILIVLVVVVLRWNNPTFIGLVVGALLVGLTAWFIVGMASAGIERFIVAFREELKRRL